MVRLHNIHVRYGTVHALRGVDFELYKGEIHALVGEHRAGKSSLVKLLSGTVHKESGEIVYRGRAVKDFTPDGAVKAGIGMVYQDLSVLPSLNAIENIFAGRMIRRYFVGLDFYKMLNIAKQLFRRLNLEIDLEVPVYRLTQGQRLMVEFARILLLDPDVIILDEPSNKLTPFEMQSVYEILFDYRRQGKSIVYITHDIEETLKLADRVTILKDGYRRGTEPVSDLDQYRLFQLTYSFALGKKEIENSRMQFYLLKRYCETFISHLPIGIIIVDADGALQFANFDGIEMFNLDGARARHRSLEALLGELRLPIAEEVGAKVRAREQCAWDEVRVGEDGLVKIDVFPALDAEEAFVGTAVLIQDLSVDRYMKDYIIRAEKMAAVAEVAAGVAHEINNPLFIIRNYIELLKDTIVDKNSAEKLRKIETELARIVEIIGSLLSFSRIRDLPGSRTNLVELIDDVLLLLEHSLLKKKIRVEKRQRLGRAEIVGDENRLKQLFLNLLLNSIDAVLDGGLIQIGIVPSEEERFVEVTVADNGYGIPQNIQDKIFSPFFSTKMSKQNTGLGLSICQRIAEAHGGIITFSSNPGELTEFRIKLPTGEPARIARGRRPF